MEIIIGIAINFLSQILKKYVAPKYGEDGVQFSVFLLACIASGLFIAYKNIPSFENFVLAATIFFGTAVTFYEVLWKKLKWVKSTKELE